MFFKLLKKYVEENFASKREVENIKIIASDLNNKICSIQDENNKIKRVLKNHVYGEITGFSIEPHLKTTLNSYVHIGEKTYVYKDGEEYIFNGLYLENPVFEQGNKENIVFATSKGSKAKYVLDLRTETFIQIDEELQKPDSDSVKCDDNLIDISVKIDSKKLKDALKNYQEEQGK